ncbi:MAG TPA: hypothetical protein V6D05_12880 [Stenomitos sp.]
MIRSAGHRPYTPTPASGRAATRVKAGGGQPVPVATPAQAPAMSALQQLGAAVFQALSGFFAWLRSLFKAPDQPMAVSQPMGPMPTGQAPNPTSPRPSAAPLGIQPGVTVQQGGVTAGARVSTPTLTADGSVRVDARGVSGQGNVAGTIGDARVLGTVAANSDGAAAALRVAGPRVEGAIAGVLTRDTQLVAGQVAAQVGEEGTLRAAGLYQDGPQGVRANAEAAYRDRTTEAGIRYDQDNDRKSLGGYVNKALPHSSLALGGDYLWSPEGNGGRAYGRWQSDAIGEQVGGFTVKGALEAGAVKLPGQDWSTYAAGRVTAEKDNAALFAEINHQAGPGFAQPDTTLKFGAQFRF